MRWMDLESVIQSGASQKEENKCRMLTHIYGLLKKKNGSEEPRSRTGIKDTGRGKGKVGRSERVALTYIHYLM